MTFKSKLLIIAGIAIALVFITWVSAYLILNNTYNRGDKQVRIIIPQGAALGEIADSLYAQGVIYNKTSFKMAAWLSGKTRQLFPGTYYFPPHLTNKALLRLLTTVHLQEVTITIPEGLRSDEITSILSEKLELDSAELSRLMTDSTLLAIVDHGFVHLEGTLFPDTYRFVKGESARRTLERLLRHFNNQLQPEWLERADDLGMTIPEIITLASLVEKETANPAERHLIAGVYHNRLRQRMLLNCDPTLIYALVQMGEWDGDLKLKHKEMGNPYNTYRYRGLPPTPIANPGSASIKAALYPEETPYFYFVGKNDGSGKHAFSITLREHINNVNRYQRRGQ
ncbi:MAG: endolytic transglycosylase MltG [Candidatus Marinimicrobia bacterium]|nr:endolytic transglycosylase MltG [Candidatus Neomarinimicrobiota bacterium]MCF7839828.1 endolytic transglycosylase MltG [Candidatus Neomarinimicrobiota bacterium]MCF7902075.1 endolytic transglycosylase MltG [Candidatus Neomarinimicrobiota bacterium]